MIRALISAVCMLGGMLCFLYGIGEQEMVFMLYGVGAFACGGLLLAGVMRQ